MIESSEAIEARFYLNLIESRIKKIDDTMLFYSRLLNLVRVIDRKKLQQPITLRTTGDVGDGAFLGCWLPKHFLIIEYSGDYVFEEHMAERDALYANEEGGLNPQEYNWYHPYKVYNKRFYVCPERLAEGEYSYEARFVNTTRDKQFNCANKVAEDKSKQVDFFCGKNATVSRLFFFSTKSMKKGTQLLIDYGKQFGLKNSQIAVPVKLKSPKKKIIKKKRVR